MPIGLGKTGEELVAKYYEKLGYSILTSNFFNRFGKQTGEIDLIAVKGKDLVFIEVKARTSSTFGNPFDAVNSSKQRKIVKTAKLFIKTNPQYENYNIRIDVAGVVIDPVRDNASNGIDKNNESVIILENAVEDTD
jgi:putative endonuclease